MQMRLEKVWMEEALVQFLSTKKKYEEEIGQLMAKV